MPRGSRRAGPRPDAGHLLKGGGAHRKLGIEVGELSPGRVVAKLSVEERHLQPFGVMHGGVSVTLAETVASAGAWLNCPPSRAVLVSSVSANHILPVGPGERLEAVGIPLNVGLDRQVWDVEVRCESRELVCACRCTLGPAPGGMALPERVE